MQESEIRRLLAATGEEIRDEAGTVLGYVSQPARFRLHLDRLARGGFLIVTRDEESGEYVGTEFDALPHPRTGEPYPAGHSEEAWRAITLVEAVDRVLSYWAGEVE